MFAQSLVEYGALSSSKFPVAEWIGDAQNWIVNASPTTWMIVAAVFAIALSIVRSRRG
jgi:hypothetical protein